MVLDQNRDFRNFLDTLSEPLKGLIDPILDTNKDGQSLKNYLINLNQHIKGQLESFDKVMQAKRSSTDIGEILQKKMAHRRSSVEDDSDHDNDGNGSDWE